MYNKVDTNLNFVDREAEVLKFWKENDIANKCISNREGCDTFTFTMALLLPTASLTSAMC